MHCFNLSLFFTFYWPTPGHISKEHVPETALVGRLINISPIVLVGIIWSFQSAWVKGLFITRRKEYFIKLENVYLGNSIGNQMLACSVSFFHLPQPHPDGFSPLLPSVPLLHPLASLDRLALCLLTVLMAPIWLHWSSLLVEKMSMEQQSLFVS